MPCDSQEQQEPRRTKSIFVRLEIVNQQGHIGDIEMDLILGASPSEVNVQVVQVDGKTY